MKAVDRALGTVTGARNLSRVFKYLENLIADPVRQAKADFPQHESMAPVLAIAGMVAKTVDVDGPLTPLERFLNLSSPGRTGSNLFIEERE
jgi:hypothetical protein